MIQEGFISNLIVISFAILIFSGWFYDLFSQFHSKKKITLFLFVLFILSYIELPLSSFWKINIGGFLVPFIIYFSLWFKVNQQEKLQLFTATLLLGASYFLFKEFIRLDPILLFWDEIYEVSLLVGLIVIIIESEIMNRILLIIGGTLLGESFYIFYHHNTFTSMVLGNEKARDITWITFLLVVLVHTFTLQIKKMLKGKSLRNLLRIR